MNVFARIWSSLGRLARAFDALADTIEAVSASLRERAGLPAAPATVPQLPLDVSTDQDEAGTKGEATSERASAVARRGRVSKS